MWTVSTAASGWSSANCFAAEVIKQGEGQKGWMRAVERSKREKGWCRLSLAIRQLGRCPPPPLSHSGRKHGWKGHGRCFSSPRNRGETARSGRARLNGTNGLVLKKKCNEPYFTTCCSSPQCVSRKTTNIKVEEESTSFTEKFSESKTVEKRGRKGAPKLTKNNAAKFRLNLLFEHN